MARQPETKVAREFDQTLQTFARIFAPVLLVLVIATAGYIYVSYLQLRETVFSNEAELTNTLYSTLQAELDATETGILDLARQPSVTQLIYGSSDALLAIANDLINSAGRNPALSSLQLVDRDGAGVLTLQKVGHVLSLIPIVELVNVADLDLFRAVSRAAPGEVLSSQSAVRPVEFFDEPAESSWLSMATPLYDNAGEFSGAILAGYTSTVLEQRWRDLESASRSYIWVQDDSASRLISFAPPDAITATSLDQAVSGFRLAPDVSGGNADLLMQGQLDIAGGHYSYSRFCVFGSCRNTAATPANDASGLPGIHWTVVSYLSPQHLGMIGLLQDEANQWHPVGTMLAFFMLMAGVVTWIFSVTLTRLRNKEKEIVLSNELHEAFFEKNPSILFVKDLKGKFYLANESCRRLAGNTNFNLKGQDRMAVFPSGAARVMQEQDQQVIASGETMEFHTKWPREDGLRYYTTLRFPMFHKDGEMYAVGGIANDITDQVQSRKALKEREELLRTLLESAPEAVIIAEGNGEVSLGNKQAEIVFEFSRRELEGKQLTDLLPGVNQTVIKQLLEGPDADYVSLQKQMYGQRPMGRQFPAEVSISPVKTASGNLIICMVRDITERTVMDARLRQSQKLEAIGKLTGGMAHDFNNLLGIIIGNIDLALRKTSDEEKLRKRLDTAKSAAERGAELTKRMLAVARRQPLQPEPASVNDIISEVAGLLPRTLGPDIEMRLDLAEKLPPVLIDASGLENVFINLAINARDAMPNGGEFSIVSKQERLDHNNFMVRRNLVPEGEYIHIVVTDTGTGMSRETLNHAFEPFFSTKEKGKGSGMGLSMAYGFVKQSNGYIDLTSEPGAGTYIDIYLPIADSIELRPRSGKMVEDEGPRFVDKTVLVVDDEQGLLDVAVSYLEDMGFSVLASTCSKDALDRLSSHPNIDLLITDIVMPGTMNGVALAAEVRKNRPDIKILYVSGFPSGVIEDKAGVEMDAPLLNKPYNRSSLASTVARVLM